MGARWRQGKKADLIMIDFRRAHLVPRLRVVSTFVHQGQGRDVTDVMVDGAWLMREGKVLTMDEDATVAEAQRVSEIRLGAAVREAPGPEADRRLATDTLRRPADGMLIADSFSRRQPCSSAGAPDEGEKP
jgi:hypothetical protein